MKTKSVATMLGLCSVWLVFTGMPRSADAQQKHNNKKTTTSAVGENGGSGCGLVPISLLENMFGQKFDDEPMEGKMPPAYDGAWGTTCRFSPKPPFTKEHPTTVDFIVFVEASPAVAKQTFDQAAAYLADSTKPKPGIGDSSYWAVAQKNKQRIAVLKGKTHFSLELEPTNESKLKELASAVAARM